MMAWVKVSEQWKPGLFFHREPGGKTDSLESRYEVKVKLLGVPPMTQ